MYYRLLLLALLPIRKDVYEREAVVAIRRYLFRLCLPALVVVTMLATFCVVLVYGLHVNAVYPIFALCAAVWLLWVVHAIRCGIPAPISEHEIFDPQLSMYVGKLCEKNNLEPLNVYWHHEDRAQAWIIRHGTPRVIVTNALKAQCDYLGMIGVLAHELAHRELPLGSNFPDLMQTCVHYVPDKILVALNKKTAEASKEFIVYQKIMEPREATRRLVELALLHAANKLFWHLSSSPALRLREHACDAIAVCMLGHAYPLIHGLSGLHRLNIKPYPYVLDAHPEMQLRIETLKIIEHKIASAP